MGNDGGGAHTSDHLALGRPVRVEVTSSVRRVPRILTGGGRVSRARAPLALSR